MPKRKMSWWCDDETRKKLEELQAYYEASVIPGAGVTLAQMLRTAVHHFHQSVIGDGPTGQDKTE